MALTPSEHIELNTIQDFTPTMESGISHTTSRYSQLDNNLVYIEGDYSATTAMTRGYIITLPSNLYPKNITALSIMARDSNSAYQNASAILFQNGRLYVVASTACTRFFITGVYAVK